MNQSELKRGDVVQLNEKTSNKFFIGALMIVTDPKAFGAQGCVHGLDRGHAYYRATWAEMNYIGFTDFVPGGDEE